MRDPTSSRTSFLPGRVTAGPSAGLVPPLLVAIGVLVYANSFAGVFLFDDLSDIVEDATVRQGLSAWRQLAAGVRPLTRLSFAANWSLGRDSPTGYHAVNLVIHVAAALTLFGIVWRSLSLRPRPGFDAESATTTAFLVALLWMVHPLQTESVTYVVQRYESLASLWYLLTLYAFIRGTTSGDCGGSRDFARNSAPVPSAAAAARSSAWLVWSVVCCAAGMLSKEIVVTAPALVLLYDHLLLATPLREIVRRRWAYYAALAVTPLLLAGSVGRVATGSLPWAGFRLRFVTPTEYLSSQPGVLLHYLRLCLMPWPQCFDWAWPPARTAVAIVVPGLAVLAMLALVVVGLVRSHQVAFLGAVFFLILAPTSSFMPLQDLAWEHRMYLPSAAVVAAVVLAARAFVRRIVERGSVSADGARAIVVVVVVLVAGTLGTLTHFRNRLYASPVAMWKATVAIAPHDCRNLLNLSCALMEADDATGSVAACRDCLAINPQDVDCANNLALSLLELGHAEEALTAVRQAVVVRPDDAELLATAAVVLQKMGRHDDAEQHLRRAVELAPAAARPRSLLGLLMGRTGRPAEAAAHFSEVVRLFPEDLKARRNLGAALIECGRPAEAVVELSRIASRSPVDARDPALLCMLAEAEAAAGAPQSALATLNRIPREAITDPVMRQGIEDRKRAFRQAGGW